MPLRIACPSCKATCAVPDELRGKKARCPGCQQPFMIPGPAETPPARPAEPAPPKKVSAVAPAPQPAAPPAPKRTRPDDAESGVQTRPPPPPRRPAAAD